MKPSDIRRKPATIALVLGGAGVTLCIGALTAAWFAMNPETSGTFVGIASALLVAGGILAAVLMPR